MEPDAFRALTFDCYGTLIDWESGILRSLRAGGLEADDDALLAAFARHEHRLEALRPALPYPDVLRRAFTAIAGDFGTPAAEDAARAFAASIADWPPFPDSVEALAGLREQAVLMVLSNVDRASFAHSARRLGEPFHAVVTADDVSSYKPAPAHFERATALLAERGIAPGQVLHVAQSLFHDIGPAHAAGFATCWIDRHAGREGGATPSADATPDMTLPGLAALAAWRRGGAG